MTTALHDNPHQCGKPQCLPVLFGSLNPVRDKQKYKRSSVKLRLTKIDEYQFLTCLKRGLWGSKSARFKAWQKGDRLAIIVEESLAALAQVTGPTFESREKVWDNGLFPHRIPMKFIHVLRLQDRPPILGEVRDALTQQWG